MNLPEDTKFATVNPDGSQTLIFDGKTKWVYSECPTCAKGSCIEILYSQGKVCGLKFLPASPDQIPDGMIDALKASRAEDKAKWNSTWEHAEHAVDSLA